MFRRFAVVAFYAGVVTFLVLALRGLRWSLLWSTELAWGYLAAAIVVGIIQRLSLAAVWKRMAISLGAKSQHYPSYNLVYARAWMGRYVPGKVAMVAARIYMAGMLQATGGVIAVASFLEIGIQVLLAAIVGVAALPAIASEVPALDVYAHLAYGLAGALALTMAPPILNRLLRLVYQRFRPEAEVPELKGRMLVIATFGFLLTTVMFGCYINLLVGAVAPQMFSRAFIVWGVFCLAGALGVVAVFAPSGLGVREAVQLSALLLFVPKEVALVIVVLARVGDVAIDLSYFAVSVLWARVTGTTREGALPMPAGRS